MQQHAVAHYTSSGTVALVAAPSANHRIKVNNLHLSAGVAETVTIGFSSTNQRVWNIAANASVDYEVESAPVFFSRSHLVEGTLR